MGFESCSEEKRKTILEMVKKAGFRLVHVGLGLEYRFETIDRDTCCSMQQNIPYHYFNHLSLEKWEKLVAEGVSKVVYTGEATRNQLALERIRGGQDA